MPRRFQFSLKWLFVAALVVAAFFGGMATKQWLIDREAAKAAQQPIHISLPEP